MKCYMCPRKCGVDRKLSQGFCGEKDKIRIAKTISHFMWEEPPVSGEKGTYAIFFSGCNLRCSYCQNYKISRGGVGKEYTVDEFVELLKEIDKTDNDSIDLITPTHFVDYIIQAFDIYKPKKKIVYNTSGYESQQTIKKIANYVDIFLPDFKYCDPSLSLKLSRAEDYFEVASCAIKLMSQLKENVYENDSLKQGVIIRHLVLPENVKDSIKILDFISQNIKDPIISLMSQFIPSGELKNGRKINNLEYKTVLSHANKLGLNEGYFQELSSSSEDYIPNFDE